jgi:aldehyde:ferredoxin oxidoreductase
MGYKNLKAIVVMQGSRGVEIADKKRLLRCIDEISDRVRNYHLRDEMMLGGTMTMSRNWIGSGELARMATELVPYPGEAKEMLSEIYEIHKASRRKIACITCPMSDKDRLDLSGSGIRSYATALFSAETLMTFSQAYGHCTEGSAMDRYTNAVRYMDMVNRYGIDKTYGFYGVIDFVVTLYERGIITKEDTGGFELNREFDTLLKLVEMTAMREGFGDILAEGIVGAARRIGKGAENSLIHVVKGQCVASDPRIGGMGPMQFAQLVHPGRAFGVAAAMGAVTYSPGGELKELRRQAVRCGVPPEAMARIFTDHSFNVARLTKHGEDFFNLFNMLGQCHRLYISRFYSMDILAELYSSITGVDVSVGDLKLASERSWDLWKRINHRVGYDRQDDEPPNVWFEPLKGPDEKYHLMDYFKTKQLFKEDVDGLLDDYYDERGWDIAKGLPFDRRI